MDRIINKYNLMKRIIEDSQNDFNQKELQIMKFDTLLKLTELLYRKNSNIKVSRSKEL